MARRRRLQRSGLLIGVLALAALAACGVCPPGGRRWYAQDPVTISATASTSFDTTEAAGAEDVPLLGLVVNNPAWLGFTIERIRFRGEGNVLRIRNLRLVVDTDGSGTISEGETVLWTRKFWRSRNLKAKLEVPIPPATSVTLLLVCDIHHKAPPGASFRVYVDGPEGDVKVDVPLPDGEPEGRAASGWRTVGSEGTLVLAPAVPARDPFTDPGETDVPALAAQVRASTAEGVAQVDLELDAWGADAGWDEISWDLWIDEDLDGRVDPASSPPLASNLALDPNAPPIFIRLPEAFLPGATLHLLLTANVGIDAPDDDLFGVRLTLVGGTGASSERAVALRGEPVEDSVRVGTRGMVVAAGYGMAILDPIIEGTVGSISIRANRGVAVGADGRWAAAANAGCWSNLTVVDLRGLRVGGTITLPGHPRSIVASLEERKVFVSLESGSVAEVGFYPDLSGGAILRYLLNGSGDGLLAINPTGERIYLALLDGTIRVGDTASGRELETLSGPPPVAIALCPDETRLLVVSQSWTLYGVPLNGRWMEDSGLRGSDIAIAPEGDEAYLLAGGVVSVVDPTDLLLLEERTFQGSGVAVAPGDRPGRAVVLGEDGEIFVLDRGAAPYEAVPPTGYGFGTYGFGMMNVLD